MTHNDQEAALIARLRNVHPDCSGRQEACVIHAPTQHHMRGWHLHWRGDRGIFERIDPVSGIGHPDPDQFHYWQSIGQSCRSVHGCDGACAPPRRLTPVFWSSCDCHVWPLIPGARVGRCGECKQVPHSLEPEPATGRAHRLIEEEAA